MTFIPYLFEAIDWAKRKGLKIKCLTSYLVLIETKLDNKTICMLPIKNLTKVCLSIEQFFNLSLDMALNTTGMSFFSDDLEKFGTRIEESLTKKSETQ